MNAQLRNWIGLVLSMVGGVFWGVAVFLPRWDTAVHVPAVSLALVGGWLAIPGKRRVVFAGSASAAVIAAIGTLARGTWQQPVVLQGTVVSFRELPMPSLLLIVLTAVVAVVLWSDGQSGKERGQARQ